MNTTYSCNSALRTAGMFSGQDYQGGVLIVDDESASREMIRTSLEKLGYYVVDAEDGQEAITLLNQGEHPMVIDVIITDVRMPHCLDIETMDYFQREYPSIQLIALTGFPDLDLAMHLMKRGVTDYMVKPVDQEKLAIAVAHAMNTRHHDWFS